MSARGETVMTKTKLVLAAFALVVASAVTFRLVTGQCPVGAFCHMMHGDAKATTTPPAAN
jgi:hypothetical protein